MKYKVWDKKNKKWVTSNIVVDAFGNLWWTFGDSMTMIDDKENYVVCRGFKFGDTWVFEGDKVHFELLEKSLNGVVNLCNGVELCIRTENEHGVFVSMPILTVDSFEVVGNQYTD